MVISCDGEKIKTNAAHLAFIVELGISAFTEWLQLEMQAVCNV